MDHGSMENHCETDGVNGQDALLLNDMSIRRAAIRVSETHLPVFRFGDAAKYHIEAFGIPVSRVVNRIPDRTSTARHSNLRREKSDIRMTDRYIPYSFAVPKSWRTPRAS